MIWPGISDPHLFETSGSDADFGSEEEERLTAIMGREPAECLPSLSSNQSVAHQEETYDVVSPR